MNVQTVFFDVGETLVDETRLWGGWADWLGVPWLTFFGTLGGVIARGEHHRRVFELLRPGFDLAREAAARAAAGQAYAFEPRDFYPDALACLAELRRRGYQVGLAGNNPAEAEAALRAMRLPIDYLASSASWGVEKPAPAFFARVAERAGQPPAAIAYVGDRADNDVAPAARAGMHAVFLLRGPWAFLQASMPDAALASAQINSLAELPDLLGGGFGGPIALQGISS